jgi:hypothetical protein
MCLGTAHYLAKGSLSSGKGGKVELPANVGSYQQQISTAPYTGRLSHWHISPPAGDTTPCAKGGALEPAGHRRASPDDKQLEMHALWHTDVCKT